MKIPMQIIRSIIGVVAVSSVIVLGGCAAPKQFKPVGQLTIELERAEAICAAFAHAAFTKIHGGGLYGSIHWTAMYKGCMAEKGYVEAE